MAIVYTWPDWAPNAFEMRVIPNFTTFTSTYTKDTQVLDFLGERWMCKFDLPNDSDTVLAGAREAFFDRLRGPVNLIALWNLRRPVPQGTMRGSPTVSGAVVQLANLLNIQSAAGATLRAGDHIGIGSQMVRVMADATANGTGLFTAVEFMPRARTAITSGTGITWYRPMANFMLTAASVPVVHRPGMFEGSSLDLIQVP